MALLKEISKENGISATYWRIDQLNGNFSGGAGNITLLGYVDQSYREKGLDNFVMRRSFRIPSNEIQKMYGSHINSIQKSLVLLNGLSNKDQIGPEDIQEISNEVQQSNIYTAAYKFIKSQNQTNSDGESVPGEFSDAEDHFQDLS